ncbi:hypothetical protein HMPREF1872_01400 [Amygdalobacter nucleatus]|uniref:Uncharacterized protein n=1 Tax=Amygdalobacter nucleatus TaxID=3029274 RepID=A0A133Y6Y9_9FIRM|nr:hypothetical protein HMPREF1872_01400 [Amygdalobacter nucleatus]
MCIAVSALENYLQCIHTQAGCEQKFNSKIQKFVVYAEPDFCLSAVN